MRKTPDKSQLRDILESTWLSKTAKVIRTEENLKTITAKGSLRRHDNWMEYGDLDGILGQKKNAALETK